MISRTRFLITAALVCHLLLAPPLVTSQLRSETAASQIPAAIAPSGTATEEVKVSAITQEKDGPVFKLRGAAEVRYHSYILYADEMTYDSQTGEATAEGHVVLDGGPYDEHLRASHGTYNLRSESGRFFDVNGTVGLKVRGSRYVLTTSSPFVFTGKVVEKTGPDHYVVNHGTVTTCELPHPKWEFRARKVVVDAGANAKVYHSSFLVGGLPVFYFPFATHPVEKQERQSGLLIPSVGNSSRKGYIVGESVYWAINRSMDATLGAEYFSLRGWSQRGEFRMRPNETSFIDLNYFGVIDRGIGFPPVEQGGQEVRLNGEGRFSGFRGVANIDYLSSFVFRQAFNETFSQAVYSEVKSQVFLSKTANGFSFNTLAQRYQNFESTQPGDVVTILHMPSVSLSTVDRQIGRTPLYWSFDAAAEGLSRSEPGFRTGNLLGRFDLSPTLSLPLLFRGWSVRPEVSFRETLYSQQLSPSTPPGGFGVAIDNVINRKALLASLELRPPSLSRVFEHEAFGRKWKHVIEPRFVYSYATGVNNYSRILHFDDRDILTNTHEVEYAIVNRLYAKRRSSRPDDDCSTEAISSLTVGGASPQSMIPWERSQGPQQTPCHPGSQVREVLSWELAQKYFIDPTFGGALADAQRNVFTTTADFTGIAFLTQARHLSPLISRLRIETSARTNAEWDVDYDFRSGRLNASSALINYHFGQFTVGGGDAFLRLNGESLVALPQTAQDFHQFRVLFGYGYPNKRGFAGAASFGFDDNRGFLQYGTIQTTYNWDCCGLSIEYRRFALGSVRNENQFRFAFSLANVGAFGNLRRQERLF
jgi:LPS-assembly protein